MNNDVMKQNLTQHQIILLLLMAETKQPMELYDFMRVLDERYIKNTSPRSGMFNLIVTPRLMGALNALQDMHFVAYGKKENAFVTLRPYGEDGKMVAHHPHAYSLTPAGEQFAKSLMQPRHQPTLTLVR